MSSLPIPRAVLFDLDDTILAYRPREALLLELAQEFATELSPLLPRDVADTVEREFKEFWANPINNKAWRTRLQDVRRMIFLRALRTRQENPRASWEALAHRLADKFHARREREMTFFPGACETIDTLRARGILLALVTNGASEIQRTKIDRFGLGQRFHHIQIEGEHGFGKPEVRSYQHALEVLSVRPDEAWMVGDNLEFDVAAPQRLGIRGIWHDHLGAGLPPSSTVKPDLIIRSLRELLGHAPNPEIR